MSGIIMSRLPELRASDAEEEEAYVPVVIPSGPNAGNYRLRLADLRGAEPEEKEEQGAEPEEKEEQGAEPEEKEEQGAEPEEQYMFHVHGLPPEIAAALQGVPGENAGYTLKYSRDRLCVSVQAEKTCQSSNGMNGNGMLLAVGYRSNASENFNFPYGWKGVSFSQSPT